MSSVFIIGHLQTNSEEARNQIIGELDKVAQFTLQNEPGTYKYAITIPKDESDETSIYVIEEYADQASFATHQTSSAFKDLVNFAENENLYAEEPVVYELTPFHILTRPKVLTHNDPYIVFGTVEYQAGKMVESMPYWKNVFSTTQTEEAGSLVYALCSDHAKPDVMRTVEVYESKEYLWDPHAKSDAVVENVKNTKHLRTGLEHVFLQIIAGYLYKSV